VKIAKNQVFAPVFARGFGASPVPAASYGIPDTQNQFANWYRGTDTTLVMLYNTKVIKRKTKCN
jgi:hypothetical protein